MAEINYQELVEWIAKHPEYGSKLEQGVSANQVLYIRFGRPKRTPVESDTFTTADGLQLVVDREKDGTVVGVEIT